jgi:hypothetical protein
VLKVRGISLNDDALSVLGPAIARRVRSLDIRDNHITDRGVRIILDECFIIGDNNILESGQRSPALLPYMGSEMLGIYQGEDFESFLRSGFTGRFVGRLAIEDAPEGGITHLYCAGNDLSVEGISGLIRSGRLHVLDAQSVKSGLRSGLRRHLSNASYHSDEDDVDIPGVEKLTPVMSKCATNTMTFLRIDHSLITKDSPHLQADEVIQGRYELSDTALPDLPTDAVELDATSVPIDAVELPAISTPRAELAGDPMQFVISPAVNDPQHQTEDEESPYPAVRRGSAFAPEVVDSLAAETERLDLLSPVSDVGEGTMMSGTLILSPLSPTLPQPPSPTFSIGRAASMQRPRSYSSVANERRARLNAHMTGRHNLHPAMLPHLRTLILTDVPQFWPTKELSDRLICFIRQCAEEALLARSQAKLDYSLPPGRRGHAAAIRHSADKVFALRKLVLELAPDLAARRNSKASPWHHSGTKSLTEDRDSETLWSAAETDFSFFGDEDYSFPSLESGRYAHSGYMNDKEVSFGNGYRFQNNVAAANPPPSPRYDTIALLSAFRKERKLAHQRNLAAGAVDPETEGYWDGVVQVVRPGNESRPDELIDYYGNRFGNGYLYR